MVLRVYFFILLGAAALVLLALAVDRLLLLAEDRGWLYYRRTRLNYHGGRMAMTQLGAFLEPAKRHVIEVTEQLEDRREDDARGKTRPRWDSLPESDRDPGRPA